VDLSDNTNLWGTHPAAMEVVRNADTDLLARYPVLYSDALREAAAARFGVQPEQVTTGAGSDDVLDSLWRAVAEHGGTVCYPGPTFSMIEPFCAMNGRVPVEVPWDRAADDPGRLIDADTVLVYVCRPNNPTGAFPEAAWVEALLEAAGEDGPVILFDEAYGDFAGESLARTVVEHPRAMVARTFSKAYGLAGLRVGLGIGGADLVGEVEKSRGPYKVSRLAEAAATAALRDDSGWVEGIVAETLANRERLVGCLRERGCAPLPSRANFVLVPVPAGQAKPRSDALRTHGVSVRPFAACVGIGDALRVSVGPWPLMERFLEAWDRTS
jgi:histidinol-phosphate aminotransferase